MWNSVRGSNFFCIGYIGVQASYFVPGGGRTLCTDLTTKIKPKRPCTKVVAQRGGVFFICHHLQRGGRGFWICNKQMI